MSGKVEDVQATTNAEQAARHAADQYGLNPDQFANFWTNRFGYYAPDYAKEWAERIAHGRAHNVADEKTREALRQAGFDR